MKKQDSRKTAKKRKLEDCYQNLYQAQAAKNKIAAKMWQDIINKLEADKKET